MSNLNFIGKCIRLGVGHWKYWVRYMELMLIIHLIH